MFARTGKDLDALRGKTQKASDDISGHFRKITAAAAVLGLTKLVGDAIEFADQLQKASDRTGIAVEGLQRLQFAAGQAGVDVGTITNAINRMQNQLALVGEGSATATAALTRLRIPINDFIGLKPDEQFNRVAVSIAQMESPSERTAAAIGLFGKSGAELLPVLVSTGKELDKVQAQFDAIGGPVSAGAISRVDELGDSFGALKLATVSLSTELLALGSPAIISVFESVQRFFGGLRVLTTGGDNINRLNKQIEETQALIQGLSRYPFLDAITPGSDRVELARLRNLLDELISRQRELLNLNASPLAKVGFDPGLVSLSSAAEKGLATIPRDFGELSPGERRQQTTAGDSPVLIAALEEKDLLLKINQEKLDAMLQQETDASVARVNLSGDTQTTLLGMVEAFSGQIIDWAQFRADFEQNATLATVGLVGQALSMTFQKNKGMQIAMATISTIAGVARALSDYPYPYSLVIGAAVAASGFAQIARIKATNYSSSGAVSGSVGGTSSGGVGSASTPSPVSQPPAATKERGIAQIHIHGNITGEQSMRWLIEKIRENIGDYDLVLDQAGR